jgi:hypothetical protein
VAGEVYGKRAAALYGGHFGDDPGQINRVLEIAVDRMQTGGAAGGVVRLGPDIEMKTRCHGVAIFLKKVLGDRLSQKKTGRVLNRRYRILPGGPRRVARKTASAG